MRNLSTYLFILASLVSNAQGIADSVFTLPMVQKLESNAEIRSKTVISAEVSRNLNDVLKENTGIYIKNYGSGQLSSISFRGTNAAQTDVLWNGVKLNSPALGQVDASLFNLGMCDQLQVSGISSSGNIGGSLSLNNELKTDSSFLLYAQLSYGSFNTVRSFAKARYGSSRVAGATRFSYSQSDNDFRFVNAFNPSREREKQVNARVRQLHFMQQFSVAINDRNTIQADFWLSQAQREIPPILSKPKSRESQYDYSLRTWIKWKGEFKFIKTDFSSALLQDVIEYRNPDIYLNEKSRIKAWRNSFLVSIEKWKKLNFQIEAGYDLETAKVPSYNLARSRNIGKLSGTINYLPGKEILLQLKLREHVYDKTLSPLSGAALLRYSSSFGNHYIMASLNAARNFRFPTLNDLYWVPGGNRNLKTEKSWEGDMSVRYAFGYRFSVKASGFVKHVNDWIQWISTGTYWEPRNVKQVLSRGVEVNLNARTMQRRNFNSSVALNYTYTRATNLNAISAFDQSKGKQLIYVPMHVANAVINIEVYKFFLRAINTYCDAVFTTSDNSQNLAGYYLLDIELGRDIEVNSDFSLGLSFRVNNVTDKQYQNVALRPMPGRNFEGTVRINFSKR